MSDEIIDHRILRLKGGHRLPSPYGIFSVYDRDGHLGFRVLAVEEGPTSEGVEVYSDYVCKLGAESPIQCYLSALKKGLPNLWRPKVEEAALLDSCEAGKPTWEKGSWKDLVEDLTTIIRMTAHRFKMPLESGYLMMFVYSQNECWDARLTVDPSEVFMSEDVFRVACMGRGWLFEDVTRLAPGILRRNLPIGCDTRFVYKGKHTHKPFRFTVMAAFPSPVSAHDLMASASRYEEIVAAAREAGSA